jgi:hypothetical protein
MTAARKGHVTSWRCVRSTHVRASDNRSNYCLLCTVRSFNHFQRQRLPY